MVAVSAPVAPVAAVVAESMVPLMKTRNALPSYRAATCFHWFRGMVVAVVTVFDVPASRISNWSVPVAVTVSW